MRILDYEIDIVFLNDDCWIPNFFKVPEKRSYNISLLGFLITIDKVIDK